MIDLVKIIVIAGNGGNGCVSFRREKFVPLGGPDGGTGGDGGNVLLVGDTSLNTLLALQYAKVVRARRGSHGQGKGKTGRGGKDRTVSVPIGTFVWILEDGERRFLADVVEEEPVLVARGGKGGRGNSSFVTSTQQEPLLAERGGEGERGTLLLELKLLADVGIVGKPNAGKSTLLGLCTRARPKVAPYPFTTIEPLMGVVGGREDNFVMMEVPGLVEGAHQGVGLGHQFLRHSERSRILLYLLDGLSLDPANELYQIKEELRQFNPVLLEKPMLVAVNKIDIPEVQQRIEELRPQLSNTGESPFFISAATGEGVKPLIDKISEILGNVPRTVVSAEGGGILQVQRAIRSSERKDLRIERERDMYVVYCQAAEQLIAMANLKDWRVMVQLRRELKRLGVDKALERQGIEPGDTVRIGDMEMEWV